MCGIWVLPSADAALPMRALPAVSFSVPPSTTASRRNVLFALANSSVPAPVLTKLVGLSQFVPSTSFSKAERTTSDESSPVMSGTRISTGFRLPNRTPRDDASVNGVAVLEPNSSQSPDTMNPGQLPVPFPMFAVASKKRTLPNSSPMPSETASVPPSDFEIGEDVRRRSLGVAEQTGFRDGERRVRVDDDLSRRERIAER